MRTKTIILLLVLFVIVIASCIVKGYHDQQIKQDEEKTRMATREKASKEGFELIGSNYPNSVTNQILSNDYPVKQNPGIQENASYSTIWKESADSGQGLGSYKQTTNNKKYWRNPSNGSCIPVGLCNGIYGDKQLEIPDPPCQPPVLSSSKAVRVNYYNYFL